MKREWKVGMCGLWDQICCSAICRNNQLEWEVGTCGLWDQICCRLVVLYVITINFSYTLKQHSFKKLQ